jgi:transcriptional regulator with XRE-family HTH domain
MYEKVAIKKIKKAIKETGLTQEKFAKKIQTGRSMISQWIIGNRNPSMKSLVKIASATGKPLSYFFDDAIKEQPSDFELFKKELENLNLKYELLKKEVELIKKSSH